MSFRSRRAALAALYSGNETLMLAAEAWLAAHPRGASK